MSRRSSNDERSIHMNPKEDVYWTDRGLPPPDDDGDAVPSRPAQVKEANKDNPVIKTPQNKVTE